MYKGSIRVKLPNGEVRSAELMSETSDGYRTARVRNVNGYDTVYGRVTARHGFRDGRPLAFQVRADHAGRIPGLGYVVPVV